MGPLVYGWFAPIADGWLPSYEHPVVTGIRDVTSGNTLELCPEGCRANALPNAHALESGAIVVMRRAPGAEPLRLTWQTGSGKSGQELLRPKEDATLVFDELLVRDESGGVLSRRRIGLDGKPGPREPIPGTEGLTLTGSGCNAADTFAFELRHGVDTAILFREKGQFHKPVISHMATTGQLFCESNNVAWLVERRLTASFDKDAIFGVTSAPPNTVPICGCWAVTSTTTRRGPPRPRLASATHRPSSTASTNTGR